MYPNYVSIRQLRTLIASCEVNRVNMCVRICTPRLNKRLNTAATGAVRLFVMELNVLNETFYNGIVDKFFNIFFVARALVVVNYNYNC